LSHDRQAIADDDQVRARDAEAFDNYGQVHERREARRRGGRDGPERRRSFIALRDDLRRQAQEVQAVRAEQRENKQESCSQRGSASSEGCGQRQHAATNYRVGEIIDA